MIAMWNTPKGFLTIGGVVLIAVGLLGFFLTGPTPQDSIFGETWWFDNGENWAHLVLGVVALVLVYAVKQDQLNKWVVAVLGVVGVLIGLYSLVISEGLLGANLENPADTILHLVVGAWALYAGFGGKE
ncbi:DUF4383 domain-containing protein [Candidatus Woesearchaeota archaeon]|nr:DUF4383 domain-containing protein [Candidatus Woesearchaeota archaeon]